MRRSVAQELVRGSVADAERVRAQAREQASRLPASTVGAHQMEVARRHQSTVTSKVMVRLCAGAIVPPLQVTAPAVVAL